MYFFFFFSAGGCHDCLYRAAIDSLGLIVFHLLACFLLLSNALSEPAADVSVLDGVTIQFVFREVGFVCIWSEVGFSVCSGWKNIGKQKKASKRWGTSEIKVNLKE